MLKHLQPGILEVVSVGRKFRNKNLTAPIIVLLFMLFIRLFSLSLSLILSQWELESWCAKGEGFDVLEAGGLQCGHLTPDWHAVYRQMVEQQSLGVVPGSVGELDPLSKDTRVLCAELQPNAWNPVLIRLQRA